jgi:hypothetical protein
MVGFSQLILILNNKHIFKLPRVKYLAIGTPIEYFSKESFKEHLVRMEFLWGLFFLRVFSTRMIQRKLLHTN